MRDNTLPPTKNMFIGLALIGLGVLFFISRLFDLQLWPLIVIAPGIMFFVAMFMGGRKVGAFAIPGSIITAVGFLLLYQETFNHYESWAYAWALIFPASVGVGLIINGIWSGIDKLVRQGQIWVRIGLILFIVGGVFFEVLIGISDNVMTNFIWPFVLVVLGALMLTRRTPNWLRPGPHNGWNERPPDDYKPIEFPRNEEPVEEKTEFEPIDWTRGRGE